MTHFTIRRVYLNFFIHRGLDDLGLAFLLDGVLGGDDGRGVAVDGLHDLAAESLDLDLQSLFVDGALLKRRHNVFFQTQNKEI